MSTPLLEVSFTPESWADPKHETQISPTKGQISHKWCSAVDKDLQSSPSGSGIDDVQLRGAPHKARYLGRWIAW